MVGIMLFEYYESNSSGSFDKTRLTYIIGSIFIRAESHLKCRLGRFFKYHMNSYSFGLGQSRVTLPNLILGKN